MGLEPTTCCLASSRSGQLSYYPLVFASARTLLEGGVGFAPPHFFSSMILKACFTNFFACLRCFLGVLDTDSLISALSTIPLLCDDQQLSLWRALERSFTWKIPHEQPSAMITSAAITELRKRKKSFFSSCMFSTIQETPMGIEPT